MNVKTFVFIAVFIASFLITRSFFANRSQDEFMKEIAEAQAKGFQNAQVTVNDAWRYDGETAFTKTEDDKYVAVDVSVTNASPSVDLDDIDIIDADTSKNYGSDPDFGVLDMATGKMKESLDIDPAKMRLLLVYAVPRTVNNMKLSYWGKELTPQAIAIKADPPAGSPKLEDVDEETTSTTTVSAKDDE